MLEYIRQSELKQAMQLRVSACLWCTRTRNKLAAVLSQPAADATVLEAAVAELNKYVARWETAQAVVELHVPDDQVEAVVEEAGEYLDSVTKVRVATAHTIKPPLNAADSAVGQSHYSL